MKPKTGIERITEERKRQIEIEGWTPKHDAQHINGELAVVAVLYASPWRVPGFIWPWAKVWDKRKKHSRIRQLVIAGALIAAEIDRIIRLEGAQ